MYATLKSLLLGAVLAAALVSTSAALVVTPGNVPQDDSALVRNPCDLSLVGSPVGISVLGCLLDFLAQTISISSDESLEITGGQAILVSTDDLFSRLTMSATAPASLSTVILNIDAMEDGFVNFADASGTSSLFALAGNGSNFFTLTGVTGNVLTAVSYINGVETDNFAHVTDIRAGVAGAIPEPGTYSLIVAGIAAFGLISRRRKAKK